MESFFASELVIGGAPNLRTLLNEAGDVIDVFVLVDRNNIKSIGFTLYGMGVGTKDKALWTIERIFG